MATVGIHVGGKGPITRARGFALSPKESKMIFSLSHSKGITQKQHQAKRT